MELTILIPCLNEQDTIQLCIQKAAMYLESSGIEGEVLISDNGSKDNSLQIIENCVRDHDNIRLIHVPKRGYGTALIEGVHNSYGKYIVMADADDSYDILHLDCFIDRLNEGYDLVIGDRFKGGIEKCAMPFSHRYFGNPFLSFVGRKLFNTDVMDFHCGLRGFRKSSIEELGLKCTDMEYASEMIAKAAVAQLRISQVPVKLYKDGRNGKSHLRSFYHGFRHLRFMCGYAISARLEKHMRKDGLDG